MVTPGDGGDGGKGREFAEFVRRELHRVADQAGPGADGLERIREKIRSRPAHVTARESPLAAAWLAVSGFLAGLVRRRPFGGGQHTVPAPGVTPAPRDAQRTPKRPRDWREATLRPAFAAAVAVLAVGLVLASVPLVRQEIVQLTTHFTSVVTGSGGAGAQGQGSHVPSSDGGVSEASGVICPTPVACSSPTTSQAATGTASKAASPSATPGGSSSPSPSVTPNPGVTPSPSGTPSPTKSRHRHRRPRPSPGASVSPTSSHGTKIGRPGVG